MSAGTIIREGAANIERLDPRLLAGDPIYLFNVYSISETVNLGTNGMYHMPACPEDKEYIRANTVIPGTVEGTYPHFTDKEEYRARPTPGEDVAKAFLGIGSGNSADEDRRRFGWFTSTNKTPTKQELDEARKRLNQYLTAKIRKGDELAASADPQERKSVDDSFYRAAKRLNVKRPWMSEATELVLCPFCGVAVRPTASKCSGCGEIINRQAYEAQKKAIGV
jgi:ribosomal protein L32